MVLHHTDVVVIGLGVAGEHVAGRLAEEGLDVVGVEAELVGGECPYWACVPSKMMVRAGDALAEARRVPGLAGSAEVSPDFAPVAARIRSEATDDWDDRAAVDRFTGKGGRFVRGRARLTGPRRVEIDTDGTDGDGIGYEARRAVVLATGSTPRIPPVPGLDGVPYWTNREAVSVKDPPGSLVVLGGGAVGLELAQVFARFGTRVTVVESADRLLPGEEPEVGPLLAEVLAAEGVTVRTGVEVTGAARTDGRQLALALDGSAGLTADHLLVAAGRRADLTGLGVDAVGLDPHATALDVDGRLRAGPGLWAVGDLTGHGLFTHVALYQAEIAVQAILGRPGPEADYRAVPRVTFTDPEVGSVGLTERRARDAGRRVRTGTADLAKSSRGWIHRSGNAGLLKLVEDADRGVLVGATSVGPAGGEVLYGLALAVHAEVPTTVLRRQILAYPAFHRAVEAALDDLASA